MPEQFSHEAAEALVGRSVVIKETPFENIATGTAGEIIGYQRRDENDGYVVVVSFNRVQGDVLYLLGACTFTKDAIEQCLTIL